MAVTDHAPSQAPIKAAPAPGTTADQRRSMRRLYCQVDQEVPHTDALLLLPNKVAGCASG